ncbi:phage baseplate assembly protein V [Vreelandella alkaliphila]|uniref:Phage baseplate assembly protein V n=1 Tax=Vreelandella alkaliphila TaxID=272774 RepID=A0AAJ2RXM6_9GAMM|nr:phage baseplate assembly protein V [Halomonas alkaliphila]MDX5979641.1 phage baseplate assembly protein V [Halomonas alkaliphila]
MDDQKLTFSGHKQMAEYRARVVSTLDPRGLLRVKVRVPGWWDGVPDKDLPWAEYRFNDSRQRGGNFMPAEVGDWVWLDFPNGDTRYPRITGWCHFAPEGKPHAPHEAWLGPDKIVHSIDKHFGEPEPVEPVYHKSQVMEKHGVVVEINPDGEVLLTQRNTGTAVRITKEGDLTLHSQKAMYSSSSEETYQHTGKNWELDVGQDMKLNVAGDIDITAGGDMKLKASMIYLN